MSNREIAQKLIISAGTAKTHIHNLCGKLGVHNRTEAAARARELGLV
jgi:ATP/maltotriose-dependent transcriptional regulator MalT